MRCNKSLARSLKILCWPEIVHEISEGSERLPGLKFAPLDGTLLTGLYIYIYKKNKSIWKQNQHSPKAQGKISKTEAKYSNMHMDDLID